jgi:hypothetical protein
VIYRRYINARLSGQTAFAEFCEGNLKTGTKAVTGEIILPGVNFNEALAVTAIDAAVAEIDTFNRPSVAREVDYTAAASLVESMAQVGAEFFVVAKRHDHIRHFDRRVFNPDLKLPESAFCAPDLDPIMIASKVYFPRAQAFPATRIRCARQSSRDQK